MNATCEYLYFGYLPTRTNLPRFIGRPFDELSRKHHSEMADETELVRIGLKTLRCAFQEAVSETANGSLHVLPLSGGLDSRAILGGLLHGFGSGKIQAVTFGTPGTLDYEIANQVARVAGVRCVSVDLTAEDWTWDTVELVKTAAQMEQPTWVFDAYVNRQIPERFGADCVYWSGFMGDPLAGSHLLRQDSTAWEQAQARFAERNRFARSTDLAPPGFRPEGSLPKRPLADPDVLGYDEQLDFAIRQQCLIRHTVLPKGFNYRTPFLHPQWVSFILSVPRRYREGEWLYKEILKTAYPKLFSLPTKNNWGFPLDAPWWQTNARKALVKAVSVGRQLFPGRIWGVHPATNYIDFDRALRERDALTTVVCESLQDLQKRGVVDWIDVDSIWNQQQHGQADHADALTLLASLEINLIAKCGSELVDN